MPKQANDAVASMFRDFEKPAFHVMGNHDAVRQGKIWYVNVNSMSNVWLGEEYVCLGRYGEEIDAGYPNIRYTAPYRDALYGIVTAEEKGMRIKGVHSEFVGASPYELGVIDKDWFPEEYDEGRRMMRPCVEDRFLSFENK